MAMGEKIEYIRAVLQRKKNDIYRELLFFLIKRKT